MKMWFALSLALLAACGLDEQYTGMGAGALPGDPLYPKDAVVCGAPAGGGTTPISGGSLDVADLTGYGWRLTSLELTAPLTGSTAKGVNDTIKTSIGKNEINVLLYAQTEVRASGTLELRVGAGTAAGSDWAFDGAGSTLACTLKGASFTTDTPGILEIPVTMLTPPSLPIKNLKLSGKISADGSKIDPGALEGVLTKADGDIVGVAGLKVSMLLAKTPLDADADGDGTPDAWTFTGTFTADRATVIP